MNNQTGESFSIEKANREQLLSGLQAVYKNSGFEVSKQDRANTFTIISSEGEKMTVEFKWQEKADARLNCKAQTTESTAKGNHLVSNAFFDQQTIEAAQKNGVTLVDRNSLEAAIQGLPKEILGKIGKIAEEKTDSKLTELEENVALPLLTAPKGKNSKPAKFAKKAKKAEAKKLKLEAKANAKAAKSKAKVKTESQSKKKPVTQGDKSVVKKPAKKRSKVKTALLVVFGLAALSVLGVGGIIAAAVIPNIGKMKAAALETKQQMMAMQETAARIDNSSMSNTISENKVTNRPAVVKPSIDKIEKTQNKYVDSQPKNQIPVVTQPIAVAMNTATTQVESANNAADLFGFHIEHSKDVADKKEYWARIPEKTWNNFQEQFTTLTEEDSTSAEERRKLKSFMTVASFLRGDYENMTIQLIELNSKVEAAAISQLGIDRYTFKNDVGKLVGTANVRID